MRLARRRLLAGAFAALPVALARGAAPGGFSFAVLGDAPYGAGEERAFDDIVDRINADDSLRFAVHIGDLKSSHEPCSDALLERRLAALQRLALPWLYTPGDNEWTDCHGSSAGHFLPLERLQFLRRRFFADPTLAHGPKTFAVQSQSAEAQFAPFVENTRFATGGVVFACVHVVGSDNDLLPWRGIDRADRAAAPRPDRLAEVRSRESAALAWVDAAFAQARAGARALVLFFHANPGFEHGRLHSRRRPFNAFLDRIHDRAAEFGRPVLLAHGDLHRYLVDEPYPDLASVVRLQVPGSPFVGWVKVSVPQGPAPPGCFFSIERGQQITHEPP